MNAELRRRLLSATNSAAFTALAIVTAMIIGALVIVFSDPGTLDHWNSFTSDPWGAVTASWDVTYVSYRALFDSSLNGTGPMSRTLVEATPLLFAGLSVALAFRAGLFNIGGAGQLMMGATAAAYVGFHFDLPDGIHLLLALLAGLSGGMAWGSIAGFLKARTGAHEVISTIMLNFVALRLLDWFLSLDRFQRAGRNDPLTPPVAESARLPTLPGPFDVHYGLVLALAAAFGVWWLLERSTVGFRMRAVGTNPDAAKAAGMNVAATYLLSMALAGGLAGLAGTANVLGRPSFSVSGGFYQQIGFDAIALALVGRSKPGGVVAAAVLFGALKAGSTGMQAATETRVEIIIVIQALIIAFVAAPAMVSAIWRIKSRRTGSQQFSAGWGAAVTALVQAAEAATSELATRVLDRAAQRKARILCGVAVAVGLAAIVLFARAVGDATFVLSPRGEDVLDFAVPAGSTSLVLGLLAVVAGAVGAVRVRPSRATLVLALALVLFVAAMLTWATADGTTSLVGLLGGTLRRASPLALGALAGVICERAGVVNIAIEGMLLSGAFAGAIVGSAADNRYLGVLGGMAIGMVMASLLGVLSIRYKVDQIVGGTAINIFALGITSYLGARVLTEYPDLNRGPGFRPVDLPLVSDIPFVGPVLFENTPHVYATFLLVPAMAILLFRTRWGLRVRAVGEHPSAADTVGINVVRTRYLAVLLGGAIAGFGGTYFTLDSASSFEENMTAGRGFIALAALIFGRWNPVWAFGAALVFGFAEEFQGRLASLGSPIPSEFLLMAPYLVTLVVVAGLIGRARPPAADGQPFER